MVRFWITGMFMKIGEWFINKGFEVSGRQGHVEIEFEVMLDKGWPISEWPTWFIVLVFSPAVVLIALWM